MDPQKITIKDTLPDQEINNDLTLAPDSEIMVLPYDQTPDLKTTPDQQTEDSSVSFSPPQNWGTMPPDATPSASPSTPSSVIASFGGSNRGNPENVPATEESNSISILKIILISLALILLGVLIGILASKIFQPKTIAQKNNPIITSSLVITEEITPTISDISLTPTFKKDPINYTDQFQRISFLYPQDLVMVGDNSLQIILNNKTDNSFVFSSNLYKNVLLNNQYQQDKKTATFSSGLKNVKINGNNAKESFFKGIKIYGQHPVDVQKVYIQVGKDLYVIDSVAESSISAEIVSSLKISTP